MNKLVAASIVVAFGWTMVPQAYAVLITEVRPMGAELSRKHPVPSHFT